MLCQNIVPQNKNETMKLSKKFSYRNLDMFRLILLRNYAIVNSTKIDFCNRFRKLNSYTETDLELFIMLEKESPSKIVQLYSYTVIRGLTSPHRYCITSFSQLNSISESGQDTFCILCFLSHLKLL